MDLQFVLEQQSLDTLCFHYILNHTHKSKILIINSILMQLVSNHDVKLVGIFDLCLRIVEDNRSNNSGNVRTMVDKQYLKNMASLLKEVTTKYPKLVDSATQEQLARVVKFACGQVLCAVSGNDYIALIAVICLKIRTPSAGVLAIMQQMFLNPKMQVGSYRQLSRLHLYFALLKILQQKQQSQQTSDYLTKIIKLIEDEKDPRNISYVFQIYSVLLNRSKKQSVVVVKKKLFDCLEMYYPIDFEGDADQHSIKLTDIAALLDQCLTHQLFVDELRALLMVKMGAAPIGKYIGTFINTRSHPITQASITFWTNLLQRTSEQQYLQQQYDENAEYTLCDLQIQLLNRLAPRNTPINIISYKAIISWLHSTIVKKIMNNDENSKSAPFIITSLKKIMSKCHNEVKNVVSCFVIHSFINNYKNVGEIVYKLGILVPILEVYFRELDTQKIGLLILTLSQLFYQPHEQPQPRLIILKLFMLLAQDQKNKKMITQTNIHITCIQHINGMLENQGQKNVRIVKAYIDFLVEVYHSNANVQQTLLQLTKTEVRIYAVLTLCNKVKQLYQKLQQILDVNSQNKQQVVKQILSNLRLFKIQFVLEILSFLPICLFAEDQLEQIYSIVNEKLNNFEIEQSNALPILQQYLSAPVMLYYLRNLYRGYLMNPQVLQLLRNKLLAWINKQSKNTQCLTTIAFFNKSIQAFHLNQASKITNEEIVSSAAYQKQLYRMLPIEKNHYYTAEQCASWPTLVHYAWSNSEQIRKDLIQYLPTSILALEADKILPIILPAQDVQTVSKITKNIPEETVLSKIIPFVVDFLQHVDQNTSVQRLVGCNKILNNLETLSKQNQKIHSVLVKNKGLILVAVEQRVLQHRKRRARQSGRAIFSLYNSLK